MRQEHKGCCLSNESIEDRLKAFLLAKWGTQEVAAARLGYSQPELSRWLRAVREMSASRLAEFVSQAGANGHYILTGEGDPLAAPGEAEVVLARVRGLITDRGRIVVAVGEATQLAHADPPDDVAAGLELIQEGVTHLERAVQERRGSP